MDIVKIRIKPEGKITKYVVLIHIFAPNIPLAEIKRRITENDYAVVYDLDSSFHETDVLDTVSEYTIEMRFYHLLTDLQNAGAILSIDHNDNGITMEFLYNWIRTRAGIAHDCKQYPD